MALIDTFSSLASTMANTMVSRLISSSKSRKVFNDNDIELKNYINSGRFSPYLLMLLDNTGYHVQPKKLASFSYVFGRVLTGLSPISEYNGIFLHNSLNESGLDNVNKTFLNLFYRSPVLAFHEYSIRTPSWVKSNKLYSTGTLTVPNQVNSNQGVFSRLIEIALYQFQKVHGFEYPNNHKDVIFKDLLRKQGVNVSFHVYDSSADGYYSDAAIIDDASNLAIFSGNTETMDDWINNQFDSVHLDYYEVVDFRSKLNKTYYDAIVGYVQKWFLPFLHLDSEDNKKLLASVSESDIIEALVHSPKGFGIDRNNTCFYVDAINLMLHPTMTPAQRRSLIKQQSNQSVAKENTPVPVQSNTSVVDTSVSVTNPVNNKDNMEFPNERNTGGSPRLGDPITSSSDGVLKSDSNVDPQKYAPVAHPEIDGQGNNVKKFIFFSSVAFGVIKFLL